MECSKIIKRISALLDGEISEPEKLLIEEHLKSCVNCQREAEKLSLISDFLKSVTDVEASPYFIPRLKRRIKEEEIGQVVRLPFFSRVKRLAVPAGIAALFILAVFSGNYLGQRLNQQARKATELNEVFANVTGSGSFEDFSEGSLVDAYAGLLNEGGK